MNLTDEEIAATNQPKVYFNDNLQYYAYMMTPESSKMFPELSKDMSLSDLSRKWQKVVLLKLRIAGYIKKTFENCPVFTGNDKTGNPTFAVDDKGRYIQFESTTAISFTRDVMAICVSSQGVNARLLRQITENTTSISHTYDVDKKARKNIGD